MGIPVTVLEINLNIVKTIGQIFEGAIKGALNLCAAPFSRKPRLLTAGSQLAMAAWGIAGTPFLPVYIGVMILVGPALSLIFGSYSTWRAAYAMMSIEDYYSD